MKRYLIFGKRVYQKGVKFVPINKKDNTTVNVVLVTQDILVVNSKQHVSVTVHFENSNQEVFLKLGLLQLYLKRLKNKISGQGSRFTSTG